MPFFLFTLFYSSFIALSSTSFFFFWLGLEINLMSFISFLMSPQSSWNFNSLIKYFIIQSASSMLIILLFFSMKIDVISFHLSFPILLILPLFLKLGLFPFHLWYLSVMKKINMLPMILLLTWQKIPPLMMLYLSNLYYLILPTSISGIMSSILLFFSSSIRFILTFSSVMNNSWSILILKINIFYWWIFFITYSISILMFFKYLVLSKSSSLSELYSKPIMYSISFLLMIFWFSGLPPSISFITKILILSSFSKSFNILLYFLMIMSSLLMIYAYFRLSLPIFLSVSLKKNFMLLKYMSITLMTPVFLSMFSILTFLK
uniref:NADH-ubiquinone oxidoreductase chain 2 n=1 Tax=Pauropus longiramus TaxID=933850 RepID=G9BG52_9MYRI|nr:NADH dehydrogenase subunit 2 [Pauropus longiramus]ADT63090.1 NADH dehydrogenase subunit 2 [Pauropus longiramus]